jgi:hypothetical protein
MNKIVLIATFAMGFLNFAKRTPIQQTVRQLHKI